MMQVQPDYCSNHWSLDKVMITVTIFRGDNALGESFLLCFV